MAQPIAERAGKQVADIHRGRQQQRQLLIVHHLPGRFHGLGERQLGEHPAKAEPRPATAVRSQYAAELAAAFGNQHTQRSHQRFPRGTNAACRNKRQDGLVRIE